MGTHLLAFSRGGWGPGCIDAIRVGKTYYSVTGVNALVSPLISIQRVGGNVFITWNSGTLQESDSIEGTYTDLPLAASPYSIPPAGAKKFYRTRTPAP